MVGGEATVPRHLCKIGPWYEAIIYFTYCKLSKLEIGGLGIRLQSRSTGLVPKLSEITLMVRLQMILCSGPRTREPD